MGSNVFSVQDRQLSEIVGLQLSDFKEKRPFHGVIQLDSFLLWCHERFAPINKLLKLFRV